MFSDFAFSEESFSSFRITDDNSFLTVELEFIVITNLSMTLKTTQNIDIDFIENTNISFDLTKV